MSFQEVFKKREALLADSKAALALSKRVEEEQQKFLRQTNKLVNGNTEALFSGTVAANRLHNKLDRARNKALERKAKSELLKAKSELLRIKGDHLFTEAVISVYGTSCRIEMNEEKCEVFSLDGSLLFSSEEG